MFSSMILYLCFIVAGEIVGAKVLKPEKKYRWIGRLQMTALLLLIFTMGAKIGADERVLSSMGTLGVKALIITFFSLAGSVFAVFVGRKLMHLDKAGVRILSSESEGLPNQTDSAADRGTGGEDPLGSERQRHGGTTE